MNDSPTVDPESSEPAPERLVKMFWRVRDERMAAVPVCNPNLEVEAVGFRQWLGVWVGILITPWTIGLYVLPDVEAAWPRIPTGGRCNWLLPEGEYQFLVDQEAGFGPFHICTLMSPVTQFADQASARIAAEAVLEKLFEPEDGETEDAGRVRQAGEAKLTGPRLEEPPTKKGLTRRDFLRKFRNG